MIRLECYPAIVINLLKFTATDIVLFEKFYFLFSLEETTSIVWQSSVKDKSSFNVPKHHCWHYHWPPLYTLGRFVVSMTSCCFNHGLVLLNLFSLLFLVHSLDGNFPRGFVAVSSSLLGVVFTFSLTRSSTRLCYWPETVEGRF